MGFLNAAQKQTVKTPKGCPVSRDEFYRNAQSSQFTQTVKPFEFSSGGLGWFSNGRMALDVGGVSVPCTFTLSIVALGSKDLPAAVLNGQPEVIA